MKKIVLSVAAVFAFGFAAQAQDKPVYGFQQSDVFVEGNLGINTTNDKNKDVKTSTFNFNPKVGYMLNDKFAVGASFEVGNGTEKIDGKKTENKTNHFYGGVFGRYYFLDLGSRFTTYAEVGVGYAQDKIGNDNVVKTKGMNAGLDLGFNYFVTPKIALAFTLGNVISYNSSKIDADGAKSENEFNANINVFNNFFDNAKFGMIYKF